MTKNYYIFFMLICFIGIGLRYGLGPAGEYFRSNDAINTARTLWSIGDFLGDDNSTQRLGFLYWSEHFRRDPDKALELLESIPNYSHRYMTRLLTIGSIYEYKGEFEKAVKNYEFVCYHRYLYEHLNGCALLSYILFKNSKHKESYRYATLLERENFQNINFLISVMHLSGLGVDEKNFEKAVIYMKSCIKNCSYMKSHAIKALNMIEGKNKDFSKVHDYYYWKDYFLEYE